MQRRRRHSRRPYLVAWEGFVLLCRQEPGKADEGKKKSGLLLLRCFLWLLSAEGVLVDAQVGRDDRQKASQPGAAVKRSRLGSFS